MRAILPLLAALALPAQAQTCFRACLAPRLAASDVTDQQIRSAMKACRNTCEAAVFARPGLEAKLAACDPERLSDADFKRVRGASASVLAFADAFSWDVTNVFADRVIRRIDLTTQNLELQDVDLSGTGTVLPGETQTVLVSAFSGGYPGAGVATRIKAIYACPLD